MSENSDRANGPALPNEPPQMGEQMQLLLSAYLQLNSAQLTLRRLLVKADAETACALLGDPK